jgi:hypothetical protein
MSAYISADGRYRYSLVRHVAPLTGEGTCTFVMLNPSTANAEQDDPTIRRCIGFAREWGYERLKVVNLYAFRATKPVDLWVADDPVGPENDCEISKSLGGSDLTIAAWGAHARSDRLARFAEVFAGWRFYALGLTKDGAPRHPLYLRGDSQPFIYDLGARRVAA